MLRKLLLLAGLCAVVAGCGGGKKAATTTTPASAAGCTTVQQPITGNRPFGPPTIKLNPKKTYDVTIATNCGNFTIRLDPGQSPNAVTSFVSLVQRFYYDNTLFHRIVPGVLIQGGDPTASGTGGPAYSTVDPPPPGTKYTRGVVAMAKTGADAPGTAGSQFFVVTAANAGFAPDYAIIGKVIRGMDVVDRIGKLGNPDETPTQIIELENATVKVS